MAKCVKCGEELPPNKRSYCQRCYREYLKEWKKSKEKGEMPWYEDFIYRPDRKYE